MSAKLSYDEIRVPVSLERDTILECVAEMRFEPTVDSAEELLPGMLFGRLPGVFLRSSRLPMADVPRSMRDSDPNMRHQPTQRLEGNDALCLVGGRAVGVSFRKPYGSWPKVRPLMVRCFEQVMDTGLVRSVERVSLKYTNLLAEGRDEFDLGQLRAKVEFGPFHLRDPGRVFHVEIDIDNCIAIVEVIPGARITLQTAGGAQSFAGVVLSVDVIRNGPFENFPEKLPELLDAVHAAEKKVFFGLLSDATLEKLGPKWGE